MDIAALIIDMQVDFFAHKRLAQRRAALVAKLNELLAILREKEVPLLWIKQEFSTDLNDAMLEVKRKQIPVVIAGTPGALLLPELDMHATDRVVVKKRYSGFFGTNLDELLADLRCSRLIIAGINTHACVRTTVVDAYQRDYDVILARDCIESHDAEHHDITLAYLDGKLGKGMSNQQIQLFLATAAKQSAAIDVCPE